MASVTRVKGKQSPGTVKISLYSANNEADEKAEVTVALKNPEVAVAKMLKTLAQRFPPESVMTIQPGSTSGSATSDRDNVAGTESSTSGSGGSPYGSEDNLSSPDDLRRSRRRRGAKYESGGTTGPQDRGYDKHAHKPMGRRHKGARRTGRRALDGTYIPGTLAADGSYVPNTRNPDGSFMPLIRLDDGTYVPGFRGPGGRITAAVRQVDGSYLPAEDIFSKDYSSNDPYAGTYLPGVIGPNGLLIPNCINLDGSFVPLAKDNNGRWVPGFKGPNNIITNAVRQPDGSYAPANQSVLLRPDGNLRGDDYPGGNNNGGIGGPLGGVESAAAFGPGGHTITTNMGHSGVSTNVVQTISNIGHGMLSGTGSAGAGGMGPGGMGAGGMGPGGMGAGGMGPGGMGAGGMGPGGMGAGGMGPGGMGAGGMGPGSMGAGGMAPGGRGPSGMGGGGMGSSAIGATGMGSGAVGIRPGGMGSGVGPSGIPSGMGPGGLTSSIGLGGMLSGIGPSGMASGVVSGLGQGVGPQSTIGMQSGFGPGGSYETAMGGDPYAGTYTPGILGADGTYIPNARHADGSFIPLTRGNTGHYVPGFRNSDGRVVQALRQADGSYIPAEPLGVAHASPGRGATEETPRTGRGSPTGPDILAGTYVPGILGPDGQFIVNMKNPDGSFIPLSRLANGSYVPGFTSHDGFFTPAVRQPDGAWSPADMTHFLPPSGGSVSPGYGGTGSSRITSPTTADNLTGTYVPGTQGPDGTYIPNTMNADGSFIPLAQTSRGVYVPGFRFPDGRFSPAVQQADGSYLPADSFLPPDTPPSMLPGAGSSYPPDGTHSITSYPKPGTSKSNLICGAPGGTASAELEGSYIPGVQGPDGSYIPNTKQPDGSFIPLVRTSHGQYVPGFKSNDGAYVPAVRRRDGGYAPADEMPFIPHHHHYRIPTTSSQYDTSERGAGSPLHKHERVSSAPGVGGLSGSSPVLAGMYIPGTQNPDGSYKPNSRRPDGTFIPLVRTSTGQYIPGFKNAQDRYIPAIRQADNSWIPADVDLGSSTGGGVPQGTASDNDTTSKHDPAATYVPSRPDRAHSGRPSHPTTTGQRPAGGHYVPGRYPEQQQPATMADDQGIYVTDANGNQVELTPGFGEHVVEEPDGSRVRYVEVDVIEEKIIEVPKVEVRDVERIEHVPEVKMIEKIVEVPEIVYNERQVVVEHEEEVVKEVPVKQVIRVPREVVKEVEVVYPRIVEQIEEIPRIIEVPKPYDVETRVNVKVYDRHEVPCMVAQLLRPIVRESTDVVKVNTKTYEPVLYAVDVYIPKPIPDVIVAMGKINEIHRFVDVPPPQYNSLVKKLNPHLDGPTLQEVFVKTTEGHIPLLPPGELAEIIPPIPKVIPVNA